MKKTIVLLYDYLDITAKPWIDAGYAVISFDGKHPSGISTSGNGHIKVGYWFLAESAAEQAKDIAAMVSRITPGNSVHMVFGYPECTYLTTTGARWLYHPDDKGLPTKERRPHPLYPNRRKDRDNAVILADFVRMVADSCGCQRWSFENPAVSFLNTMYRRPDYCFNPADYGGYLPLDHKHSSFPDVYPSRDAYAKNTGIWAGPDWVMPEKKPVIIAEKQNPGFAKCGGKSARTKEIRSASPEGFTLAMFEANQ